MLLGSTGKIDEEPLRRLRCELVYDADSSDDFGGIGSCGASGCIFVSVFSVRRSSALDCKSVCSRLCGYARLVDSDAA